MTFMSEPGSPADKSVINLVSEGRAILEGMEPAPWLGGFTSWVNISEADAEGIVWLRNHAAELLDRLEAAEQENQTLKLRVGDEVVAQYVKALEWAMDYVCDDTTQTEVWPRAERIMLARARALLPESREDKT